MKFEFRTFPWRTGGRSSGRSNGRRRPAFTAALVAMLMAAVIGPSTALGAGPANDDASAAIPLTTFPVHEAIDLSQATTQGDEPWCEGHVASVWYRYVAPAEETLTIAVADVESATRVCVFPDAIAAGTYRIVRPSETVSMLLDAGRTYFILVGTVEAGQSATLDLHVGPPSFDVVLTLDPKGIADHVSGAAIVGGTLSCSAAAPVFLSVRVQEKLPSKKSVDASDIRFDQPCTTTTSRWEMRVSANTAFVPGTASVSIYAAGGEDVDQVTATVKLGAK